MVKNGNKFISDDKLHILKKSRYQDTLSLFVNITLKNKFKKLNQNIITKTI